MASGGGQGLAKMEDKLAEMKAEYDRLVEENKGLGEDIKVAHERSIDPQVSVEDKQRWSQRYNDLVTEKKSLLRAKEALDDMRKQVQAAEAAAAAAEAAATRGGGAASVAGVVGQGPSSQADPAFYRNQFCGLLKAGGVQRPAKGVLDVIERQMPHHMMVCSRGTTAANLYRDAQLWPGDTTKSHLLTQLGLRVNGPLFHGGLLLTAVDKSGRPCIVKLLDAPHLAGVQPPSSRIGGPEAEAISALLSPSKPLGVALAECILAEFELTGQHSTTMRRSPGRYAIVIMPKYASTVAQLPQLDAACVVQGGLRIKEAVTYIHSCGYAHMDIKAENVFVDAEGRWWLGDFGSAVKLGTPVTSTTELFAPGKILGQPSSARFDWHMLAVMLVEQLLGGAESRSSWEELLVEGACTPPHKLRTAVEAIEHEGAKDFLAELIQLADGA